MTADLAPARARGYRDRMPAPDRPPDDGAAILPAPAGWVRSVSELRLPASTDRRLTELMDRNTDGALSAAEREELAALAEVSESLSLARAGAHRLLGSAPR